MSVKPKFTISQSGTDVTLTMTNRNGNTASIYRSRYQNEEVTLLEAIDQDSKVYSVQPIWRASFQVRYEDIELALNITQDNTDQDPPYYTAENIGGSTSADQTASFNPSWGDAITYGIIRVDNIPLGTKSIRKYTKA